MTKTLPLAYSYVRFSDPNQAKGDSLRRQAELRDAWLARNPAVRLDTSMTLEDKGISGFTGAHRDNPDRHALAAFVALVKAGRIPRGSYLIVESLDRLSREDIIPALSLLLDLISNGVRVVQLLPAETVYDTAANPMQIMLAVMELSRGHSESAMKSERVGQSWRERKRRAAEGRAPMTTLAPAWLRLVDGQWQVIDEAAAVVRRIYRLATDGHGLMAITQRLNAEGVPVIGRAAHWAKSTVFKMLAGRAVLGELQPHAGRGKNRRPDGPPIPNYYPALIAEEDWYAARAALVSRRRKAGRPSKTRINVFAGLLHDARDGGTLNIVGEKGTDAGPRKSLVSHQATQGVAGSKYATFPFLVFDEAVLSCLREIDAREVLPSNGHEDKAAVLAGKLVEVEAQIEKVKARLEAQYSDAVADVLDRHAARRAKLADELAEARQQAASPLGEAWGNCRSLLDVLRAAPNAADARVKLRSAIRRITESIWCLFVRRGMTRIAAVQIWFTGGAVRDYLIVHQAAKTNASARQPARWWARSLAEVAPGGLDLRKKKDARALEKALAAVDLADVLPAD